MLPEPATSTLARAPPCWAPCSGVTGAGQATASPEPRAPPQAAPRGTPRNGVAGPAQGPALPRPPTCPPAALSADGTLRDGVAGAGVAIARSESAVPCPPSAKAAPRLTAFLPRWQETPHETCSKRKRAQAQPPPPQPPGSAAMPTALRINASPEHTPQVSHRHGRRYARNRGRRAQTRARTAARVACSGPAVPNPQSAKATPKTKAFSPRWPCTQRTHGKAHQARRRPTARTRHETVHA